MYTIEVNANIPLGTDDGEEVDRIQAAMRKGLEEFIQEHNILMARSCTINVSVLRSYY